MGRILNAWRALTGRKANPIFEQYAAGNADYMSDATRLQSGDMSLMLRSYLGWTYICTHKISNVAASVPLLA